MKVVLDSPSLRSALAAHGGRPVALGLIPTMGAFHAGHLALFERARAENELVVVSLFVNPLQFDSSDDLEPYPRDEGRDLELAEAAGVDIIFAPAAEEIYPPGFATFVEVEGFDDLEGAIRPGHFRGVATVCLRLFELVRPTRAYFGRKDAQQAALVGRMVEDLALPVEVRVLATIRDKDGLALSSRNSRLSRTEQRQAIGLYQALERGRMAHAEGGESLALEVAKERLEWLGLKADYVVAKELGGRRLLLAAINIGGVRLLDNVTLASD